VILELLIGKKNLNNDFFIIKKKIFTKKKEWLKLFMKIKNIIFFIL